MVRIIPASERAAVLATFVGAHAAIWMFQPTHQFLALLLDARDRSSSLFVVGGSCVSITGPMYWDEARIEVEYHERTGFTEADEEPRCYIRDPGAGFVLHCNSYELVLTPKAVWPETFAFFRDDEAEPKTRALRTW